MALTAAKIAKKRIHLVKIVSQGDFNHYHEHRIMEKKRVCIKLQEDDVMFNANI
jgi:hypothetical protein